MFIIFIYYLVAVNLITFILFVVDKFKAVKGEWRLPEYGLWFLSLIGGSFGGLIAMQIFRHKRRKSSFVIIMLLILIFQIFLIYFLLKKYSLSLIFNL